MSDEFGTYGFLAWQRRGIALGIRRPDGLAGQPIAARATLDLAVQVQGAPQGEQNVAVEPLALIGPGEITGLTPQAIADIWPKPEVFDVESNYFPMLELRQPDLPWRYTPAAPGLTGRLRPWLCLIALKDDEQTLVPPQPRTDTPALPRLNVDPKAPLPRLSQAWAWAHVQLDGAAESLDAGRLRAILDREPNRAVARLLCARRLEPRTAYTVFLVPVFERGRRAGLAEPVDPADGVLDALTPSWEDAQADPGVRTAALALPVYFSWRFGTGAGGDFEHLVALLEKQQVDSKVGRRPMDASRPCAGLPSASATPLDLEGALRAPSAGQPWDPAARNLWVARFAELLNGPRAQLTRKTRVRVFSAASLYQQVVHTGDTALPELAGGPFFALADQDRDGTLDLALVAEEPAGGATLRIVHDAARPDATVWQAGVSLPAPGPNHRFLFTGQALVVLTLGRTASRRVEYTLYTDNSRFSRPERQDVTVLPASSAYEFALGDYDGDGIPDLWALEKRTGGGSARLHILSGAARFRALLFSDGIELPESDDYTAMAVARSGQSAQLTLIARGSAPDAPVELITLSGDANFRESTRLPTLLGPADAAAALTLADWDGDGLPDLFVIQPRPAPEPAANISALLPLYGQHHAAQHTIDPDNPNAGRRWFHELNIDPRLRVAAALGTSVVQSQQQQLMASAWRQVGAIRRINAELRQAQLAREAATRVHLRHLATATVEGVLELCAPVHGRVLHHGQTVLAGIDDSPLPGGVLDAQWRRVARPLGPLGRRQGRPGLASRQPLLQRLNEGSLVLAPPPATPGAINTTDAAGIGGRLSQTPHAPDPNHTVPRNYNPYDQDSPFSAPPTEVEPGSTGWAWFSGELERLVERTQEPGVGPTPRQPIDLEPLAATLTQALHPQQTIERPYQSRLTLGAHGRAWRGTDALGEVMAYPEFRQPMFRPLVELSQDWLLPGLEHVSRNSVSLLEANQPFIEAYMAGLNHELGRELLWRGYPTDQRGSFFRTFWDSSGFLTRQGGLPSAEKLHDLLPLDDWRGPIGSHADPNSPTATPTGSMLVLLLRGDLLQRYPEALVYATRAAWITEGMPEQGRKIADTNGAIGPDDERHPIFSGTLKPDVSFFAFQLSQAEARGENGAAGFFFVLQEQATSLRFGLNSASQSNAGAQLEEGWETLSWGHLVSDTAATEAELPAALAKLHYINLDDARPTLAPTFDGQGLSWHAALGSTSSDVASITLQKPVRVAIHATDLLPP